MHSPRRDFDNTHIERRFLPAHPVKKKTIGVLGTS
ncbi:Protein of unknown function [Pyronema omphalodes CBS 100304]|uniref:Uncharacterized protein n=1 Tax=Pyronema omphalodes (strain CBS 100304) TaxID=1076935 RepID=U4LWI8_PYROM|nr:Protein of unknown function [Pyronema omphalodes CBS 100304]